MVIVKYVNDCIVEKFTSAFCKSMQKHDFRQGSKGA